MLNEAFRQGILVVTFWCHSVHIRVLELGECKSVARNGTSSLDIKASFACVWRVEGKRTLIAVVRMSCCSLQKGGEQMLVAGSVHLRSDRIPANQIFRQRFLVGGMLAKF